jgi:hypothetical protein
MDNAAARALAEKDNMADAPVEIAAHHCATALLSPGLTEKFKAGEIFRALVSMPDQVGVRATWVLLGASLKLQRSNPATLLTPIRYLSPWTLWARTGLWNPFSASEPSGSSSATPSTSAATRCEITIWPCFASPHSRAPRLVTVPIAA